MFGGDVLALRARNLLEQWSDHSQGTSLAYLLVCIFLVMFAGLMSGLTLGLMSMDIVELEVLRRSGSEVEARQAANIIPVVKDAHFLLVTLLLCNAIAMEALPIFLDKLMGEVAAILVSVTAVLFAGEIFPQAVCSKHGLVIGSAMAWPVRALMLVTSPISFPIAKLLDFVLGGEHASLFRRKQLKALVTLHARDEGFGGRLTADEINIITGALDLTRKTAYQAMTPLEKVFMLSTDQKLDDVTVSAVMASKPFSRLPVYRGHNKQEIVGVILVKELLDYVKNFPDSPVSSMKIRQLPRLSADTPMYDLLKLFRVGRSHMALLTQPHPDPSNTSMDIAANPKTLDGMVRVYCRDHQAHLGTHHSPLGFPRGTPLATVPELAAGTTITTPLSPLQSGRGATPTGAATAASSGQQASAHGGGSADEEEMQALLARRASSSPWSANPAKGVLSALTANMRLGAAAGAANVDGEERVPMLGGAVTTSTADLEGAAPWPAPGLMADVPWRGEPPVNSLHDAGHTGRPWQFALETLHQPFGSINTPGATATTKAGTALDTSLPSSHPCQGHHQHHSSSSQPPPRTSTPAQQQQQQPAAGYSQPGSAFLVRTNPAFDLLEGGTLSPRALHDPVADKGPHAQQPEMWTMSSAATATTAGLPLPVAAGRPLPVAAVGNAQLPLPAASGRLPGPPCPTLALASNQPSAGSSTNTAAAAAGPSGPPFGVDDGVVALAVGAAGMFRQLSSGAPGGGGGGGTSEGVAQELQGNIRSAGGTTPARSRTSLRSLFTRERDRDRETAASGSMGVGGESTPEFDCRSLKVNRKGRGKRHKKHVSTNSPIPGDHTDFDLEKGGAGAHLADQAPHAGEGPGGGGGGGGGPGSVRHLTSAVNKQLRLLSKAFVRAQADAADGGALGQGDGSGTLGGRGRAPGSSSSSSSSIGSSSDSGSSRDDLEDMLPVPLIAKPGEPIGIITIEDVIEELMGIEILDETDRWMDNEQSVPVNTKGLEEDLPDHLRDVLAVAERAKNQVLAPVVDRQNWLLQAAATVTGGISTAQSSATNMPASSVLAGLAGSMLRSALSAASDPLAAAVARARGSSHERLASASPAHGGRAPSPPKRVDGAAGEPGGSGGDGGGTAIEARGMAARWAAAFKVGGSSGSGLGSTSMLLVGSSGMSSSGFAGLALAGAPVSGSMAQAVPRGLGAQDSGVQRSDIRAAAVVAAGLGGAVGGVGRKSFADWKAKERQR